MKRGVSPDRLFRERSTFLPGVMVSGFVSKLGKAPIVFVDEGAKINADYYQKILRKQLCSIRKMSGRKFTIQQDGARSHTAKSTFCYLDKNVPDYISKDDWLANSPDLNPLDYSIWGAMDELVYRSGYEINNIETLKMAIKEAWENLSQKRLLISGI